MEDAARLASQDPIGLIELNDLVHSREVDDDLVEHRLGPPDQPGVAALRHNREAPLIAVSEDGTHLLRRLRLQ